MIVRAPGKALLCGEYAVLEGAPAVVAAVSRHATGQAVSHGRSEESAFVREATRRAAATVTARVPPYVAVDTTAFRAPAGDKLGLGSSAAATVAAAGVVLAAAGRDLHDRQTRLDLARVADEAHRAAQQGQGSGADVAASVHGGILRFVTQDDVRPLELPKGLQLVFIWTGRAASTGLLLERVRSAGMQLGLLPTLATTFADAFAAGDVRAVIETARLYGAAMEQLGERSGAPIVTREHALFAELARRHGGAAKPSGAGGGDVGVAFLTDPAEAAALKADAQRAGLHPLDLAFDSQGVHAS